MNSTRNSFFIPVRFLCMNECLCVSLCVCMSDWLSVCLWGCEYVWVCVCAKVQTKMYQEILELFRPQTRRMCSENWMFMSSKFNHGLTKLDFWSSFDIANFSRVQIYLVCASFLVVFGGIRGAFGHIYPGPPFWVPIYRSFHGVHLRCSAPFFRVISVSHFSL